MELVKDFVKDNLMFFVLGFLLFGLVLLGSWKTEKMESYGSSKIESSYLS